MASGYVSSSEPSFPVTINNIDGASATNTITIRPSVSGLSLTSATLNVPTIDLNGAKFVTIDGRVNGAGAMDLILEHTAVTGNAVRFINDATNNTIRYVNIRSVNSSTTSGTIVFSSSATGTTGNDNNTIEYCDIRDGATLPSNAIYASGTTTTVTLNNSGNIISNNNIYNFFNTGAGSYGVNVIGGNTDWTISNNNLYQTATRTTTTGPTTHYGISVVNSSSGNNFTINNNSIGGSAASTAGTAWTVAGANANRFIAINLALGTTTTSNIQGNTVANFNWSSTSGATTNGGVFCGIYSNGGTLNIGTVTGNTIGSGTGNGSIVVTSSTTAGISNGISINGGANVNISNNTIGSITANGSSVSVGHNIYGLDFSSYTAGSPLTVHNNLIGSLTTANSINCATAITSNTQFITGIRMASTNPVFVITNNTIANLNNAATNNSTTNNIRGIVITTGAPATITGNTIRNFTIATTSVGTTTSASLIGILNSSTNTTASQSISNNSIYNLRNTNTSAGVSVIGIIASWTSTATSLVCAANNIHSLSTAGLVSSNIFGIYIGAGAGMYQNNMIRLGFDVAGVSQTIGQTYAGINEFLGTNTIVNNSVYIGGTGVVSSNNTYALWAQQTTNVRAFRNNILVNDRQNASGTAVNVAAQYAGTYPNAAGLTLSHNIYFARTAANTVRNGSTNYTLNAWKNFSNYDAVSAVASDTTAIGFINARGAGTDGNLHIASGTTIAEGAGVLIASNTTDFDGETRSALTPTDIGADAGNFTANDVFGPEITYAKLPSQVIGTTNLSFTAIIKDTSGVPTTGANMPRVYFNKNTGAYSSAPGVLTSGSATNGTWTFTIDHAALSAIGTDSVHYFIVAQDIVSTPNVSASPSAIATDVNTVITNPIAGSAYAYLIVAGITWVGTTDTDWNTGTNWSGGVVPTINDAVGINNLSGNMPIVGNGVTANAAAIAIPNATGTLTMLGTSSLNVAGSITNTGSININGSTLNVTGASTTGITNNTGASFTLNGGTVNVGPQDNSANNRVFTNAGGTLTVSSGTLNISGNLNVSSGTFNQSGGNINVDGNGTVSATTILVNFTGGTYNLSGGTLTIVDPAATNINAFSYSGTNRIVCTGTHTFRMGDGVSTASGNSTAGFFINNPGETLSIPRFNFRNLTINGTNAGANRFTSQTDNSVLGTFTITASSEFREATNSLFVAGNVVNDGIFVSNASNDHFSFEDVSSGSLQPVTVPQTVSGTGIYQNDVTSPTGNFATVRANNTSVAGVTFTTPSVATITNIITITNGRLNIDTLVLGGSSLTHSLSAATSSINVQNLRINNTGTATLSGLGFLNVTGAYTKTAGILAAAGRLVLKSTANGTARLNALTAGSITGNVVVERFIPALAGVNNTARKYRFFAAPIVTQSINAGLQQRIHITGAVGTCGTQNANGVDFTTTGNTSMFDYDATRTIKWGAGISNTLTTNLTAGTGYRVLVRGSRSRGCTLLDGTPTIQDTVTLYTVGVLAQGDISATLKGDGSAFTLIGNPYASPIDWNNATWAALRTTNNITGTYYTYHPASAAGTYTTYDGTNLVNGQTLTNGNIIASGQAFFVKKTTAGSATVSNFFQETYKSSTAQPGAFRTNNVNQVAALRVGMKLAADTSHLDETIIAFATDNNVTKTYNDNFDSKSISEGAQTIAAMKDANACAIQRRPSNYIADTVALKVSSSNNGSYNLYFSDYIDITADIFIRDKFTNTIQDVKANNYYSFSTTSNPASQGVDRFEVIFRTASTLPVTYTSINAKNKGVDEVVVTWAIPSEQNVQQYEVERSSNGTNFTQRGIVASKGNSNSNVNYAFDDAQRLAGVSYYRVKAVAKSGEFKYSPVVTVKSGKDAFAVSIYPNPVKEEATLVVQNGASSYSISIVTLDGKQVLSQPKVAAQNNVIKLNVSTLAAGVYMLQVVTNDGNSITQKLIKE